MYDHKKSVLESQLDHYAGDIIYLMDANIHSHEIASQKSFLEEEEEELESTKQADEG
jgi:hypothetical protein